MFKDHHNLVEQADQVNAGPSTQMVNVIPEQKTETVGVYPSARRWRASGRFGLALRGSAWSIGGYVATQLLRTLATLVLARRFLSPEPFGVVGLVGVFIAGLA